MKIKKSLLAVLALSSVTSAAYADIQIAGNEKASLEVYGIADAMIGTMQHSYSIDPQFPASITTTTAFKQGTLAANSVTGLFNGGISPSRFGFKGNLDMGNGMKGFFTLESGINITTGRLSNAGACLAADAGLSSTNPNNTDCANSSIDGQIFSRQAFVGISDEKMGSLAVGKNYAPIFDVTVAYDPIQAAQVFSPLGFSGTFGGGGGVSEDTRVDGSLKYKNNFGPVSLSLLYKMGGVSGNSSAKGATGLGLGYDGGAFSVNLAVEDFKNGVKGASSTTTANTVAVTVYDTTAYMLGAKYKINDAATVKAGYESYTLKAPSSPLSSLPDYYGQLVAAASSCVDANGNFNCADQKTNITWLGGDYNFTDKLNVGLGYYDVALQASSDVKQKAGHQRYVSLLADYKYSKALDAYAGVTFINFSGDNYPSATYFTSNQITGAGLRFKF